MGKELAWILKQSNRIDEPVVAIGKEDLDLRDLVRDEVDLEWLNKSPVRGIVNCAGVNWLSRFEELSIERAKELSEVNIWAGVKLVQKFLDDLTNGGWVCNIISNAASVPMTHSLAYNVSKAGFEMATRQMAHELTPTRGITIFGVSPVKLEGTAMSEYIDKQVMELRGWTRYEAKAYQAEKMLNRREVDPADCARFIAGLLPPSQDLSGTVIPYGA